jgi:MinD-like ATPase involved in chromosome partitioning or flagellar assembly
MGTKTIIIYSGKGGVGKTTTTANIARTLVKQGKRVLIIDGDINAPSKEILQQVWNAYGHRVGLPEKWEELFDYWVEN